MMMRGRGEMSRNWGRGVEGEVQGRGSEDKNFGWEGQRTRDREPGREEKEFKEKVGRGKQVSDGQQ
eukprot:768056-Hanusia_phi.AAC.10